MTTIDADFELQTAPFRRELLAHCYRMLGSVHDAEDLVQETLLRAWRSFDKYDANRASMRTWLYRIATNACITALDTRSRRPLPSGFVGASDDPGAPMVARTEVPWLQPFPDVKLRTDPNDPASVIDSRGSMRLAFVAAMQFLPAKQRAVLILRDVLDWSAAEVAEALDTTPTAVNSALQRARIGMADVRDTDVDEPDPARSKLLERYVAAFENADLDALTKLLTDDVVLEMPPVLNWYVGRDGYRGFIARVFEMRGSDWKMVPIAANGQPAVAAYVAQDGGYRLHTLQVFTTTAAGIAHTVVFQDDDVFAAFDLPTSLTV
ncbi:sigma-70 family RNA polymerase sigma factor [Antrihabitans cavernicola]|uniref:RNA polymerase sigma factor n=1 Tax=Antrihabitans cavernicola TaxID=2495913 RepID=A0A5A7SAA4_9NOCA|nr:sigma-70 family RNA polymerase sigma factor [Spelaeibacter cavernicola]KAA0021767.1 sigma-70 family RNA polymerase sigma factor [Spelaeibacter cavernicola]